jgi:hypothetical protein
MSHPAATPAEVFLDTRGSGRALRLTWHHEADLVILSLWRGKECTGTFRLASGDVDTFVDALVDGLRGEHAPPPMLPPRQRERGSTLRAAAS